MGWDGPGTFEKRKGGQKANKTWGRNGPGTRKQATEYAAEVCRDLPLIVQPRNVYSTYLVGRRGEVGGGTKEEKDWSASVKK